MDHSTKKQIGDLEFKIQELRREIEEREGANEALRARNEVITTEARNLVQENKQLMAELEERKAAWEMKNERLRAKIKELEEREAGWEAEQNYQKSLTQKLEGFQRVKINDEETKFTVCLYVEDKKDRYVERARFTFPDYKSMDDFLQLALIHGEGNMNFIIQKGED